MANEYSKEAMEWMRMIAQKQGPRIKQSQMYMSLVTDNFLEDPRCALELGLAILMNKPIVLIAEPNQKIPEALVKIAKVVERADFNNKTDMERAMASIGDFSKTLLDEP